MTNSKVYVAFLIIPRRKTGNNFELVDPVIELVKKAGVPWESC